MHFKEIYENKKNILSIEVMPVRNGDDIEKFYANVETLSKLKPKFITVTQSSKSSLRSGNHIIASEIKKRFNVETVAHLICAEKSIYDIENILTEYHYLGIKNIMALRGDPPWGQKEFKAAAAGFTYAKDLVKEIQNKNNGKYILRGNDLEFYKLDQHAKYREGTKTDFGVGVAGYPESHRDCKDKKLNIKYLKEKVDEGADAVFTQMFYSPEVFFKFVDDCKNAGITVPIIPGIMPITFYSQVNFIKNICGVEIPNDYLSKLEENKDDKQKLLDVSVEYMTNLCKTLMKKGIPGLHFYTMNNADAITRIVSSLEI